VTRWTGIVDIDEVDGAIRAVSRLHDRTSDRLAGEGIAHIGPVERLAPTVGPKVATARALRRLSDQLAAAGQHDYDSVLERRARSA
jgi:Domain of unknown function (DUF1876)